MQIRKIGLVILCAILVLTMSSCSLIEAKINDVAPTIDISDDGYWVINGVKTEHKAVGTDGANGAPLAARVSTGLALWLAFLVRSLASAKE